MNAGVDSDMEGEEVQIPSTIVDVGENSDAEPIHIPTKLDNSIAAAVQAASGTNAGIYFRKCLVSLCEGNLISV